MSVYTNDREAWQNPAQPVHSTNPPVKWADVDMFIVHYTAADDLIDGDVGEDWDGIPAYLRAIQNDYVTRRGYSVGYNGCVDQRGVSWELRGEDFRNAANKGDKSWHKHENNYPDPSYHNCNKHTVSCLVLVDGADEATPEAAVEIARLVSYAKSRNPDIVVMGHKDIDRTGCPGDGLYSQVEDDVFVSDDGGQVVEVSTLRFMKERVLDTRDLGGRTAVGGQVITLAAPAMALAVKVNVTAADAVEPGFITAYPAGTVRPGTSDLNYQPGYANGNQVDVPVSDGQYSLFVKGSTHVIVDQVGYWY